MECTYCKKEKTINEFREHRNECLQCERDKRNVRYRNKLDAMKGERQKKLHENRVKLRAEFETKHNLEHEHGMLERHFETENGYKFVDTFIHEEDFEDMLMNIKSRYPETEPEAVELPEEIYAKVAERNKADMRFVRAVRIIMFNELNKLSMNKYLLT